jgi:hypothetical protein
MNSLLGSLGLAIPGADAVKELKEGVEQTLKVDRKKKQKS